MPSSRSESPHSRAHEEAATLHPPIEPFDTFMLDVGDGHRLHVEQCGNPDGLPVVVLHGGPGSGTSPMQRRLLDPVRFRIVLFDQRGCGRSAPAASVSHNDTPALIRDIESIRERLDIAQWIVFGGSWGASLAIAYGALHRERCLGMVLRGVFLTGRNDLDWFFGQAGTLLPQPWDQLRRAIGLAGTDDSNEHDGMAVLDRLARLVMHDDARSHAAAMAWTAWESAVSSPGVETSSMAPDPMTTGPRTSTMSPACATSRAALQRYRVQSHYLAHQCFLGERRLLQMAHALSGLPVAIVHGRLDWVCRPINAWTVHQAIDGSTLYWIDRAGHVPYEPAMVAGLNRAIDEVARRVALSPLRTSGDS